MIIQPFILWIEAFFAKAVCGHIITLLNEIWFGVYESPEWIRAAKNSLSLSPSPHSFSAIFCSPCVHTIINFVNFLSMFIHCVSMCVHCLNLITAEVMMIRYTYMVYYCSSSSVLQIFNRNLFFPVVLAIAKFQINCE